MSELKKMYHANIKISFIYGDNQTIYDINPRYISYISIISNYDNQVIPVIMLSMNVIDELYELMINYKNDSKFFISLDKSNITSTTALTKNIFSDYFSFIMSDTSPNPMQNLNQNQGKDDAYRRLNIGLVSYKMINYNRITFNGIYKDIDTNTLLYLALDGIDCVCEPIQYNTNYETLIVPPLTSRYKFLEFIQNIDPFFDTRFKYFMDFDSAYLMSENYTNNITKEAIINIQDPTVYDMSDEGSISNIDDRYYMNIPSTQYNIDIDQYKEKVLDKIIGVDYDFSFYDEYSFDSDDIDTYDITKDIFVRTDSANIIKNKIESSKITVTLYINNTDGSIFTPDRYIKIIHYDQNFKKYDGEYKLVDKKEVFVPTGSVENTFKIATMLTVKPVGNISKYNPTNFKKCKQYISDTTINKNVNID